MRCWEMPQRDMGTVKAMAMPAIKLADVNMVRL